MVSSEDIDKILKDNENLTPKELEEKIKEITKSFDESRKIVEELY